jgi:hypothetical protein
MSREWNDEPLIGRQFLKNLSLKNSYPNVQKNLLKLSNKKQATQ